MDYTCFCNDTQSLKHGFYHYLHRTASTQTIKLAFTRAAGGFNLIQGHVCVRRQGMNVSAHKHMQSSGKYRIHSDVWTRSKPATSSFCVSECLCKSGSVPAVRHHTLLSLCTSCLLQGGEGSLITHTHTNSVWQITAC